MNKICVNAFIKFSLDMFVMRLQHTTHSTPPPNRQSAASTKVSLQLMVICVDVRAHGNAFRMLLTRLQHFDQIMMANIVIHGEISIYVLVLLKSVFNSQLEPPYYISIFFSYILWHREVTPIVDINGS